MGTVSDVQEGLKAFGNIAVKPLIAVAVASALLLFLPAPTIGQLGVESLLREYRAYIGGAFIVSCSYLAAHLLAGAAALLKTRFTARARKRQQMQWLRELTPDEKALLIPFVRDQRASRNFSIDNGVVGGLVAKRILFRSSNMGDLVRGFPYNLQPWAREVLNENPTLLDGADKPQTASPNGWMSR
jgi:hypothetical protein